MRGIQEKAIRPIGGQQELAVDVRILSATHKDLAQEVEHGTFRQDLFYRINVIELSVPSLRERADDIPILAEELLRRVADEYQIPKPKISDEAINALKGYLFPGNVRELENVLERAITLCEDDVIKPEDLQLNPAAAVPATAAAPAAPSTASDLPEPEPEEPAEAPEKTSQLPGAALPEDEESLDSYPENIEKTVIVDALESTRWNKTAAAKKLGITFRALRYKLKKLGLE